MNNFKFINIHAVDIKDNLRPYTRCTFLKNYISVKPYVLFITLFILINYCPYHNKTEALNAVGDLLSLIQ